MRFGRGPQAAVSGVSFVLAAGGGLLVHGPPGSGKSALVRGILGLAPHSGQVRLFGRPPFDAAALRRVGYAPAGRPVPSGLRASELAGLVARVRGLEEPAEQGLRALLTLGVARPSRVATALDAEETRRLTLALATLGEPELLVLDDPWESPETAGAIGAARARGAAVLVTAREPGLLAQDLDGRTLALSEGRAAA